VKFLVTGGAGFIGRWTVHGLLAKTSATIVVLDDFSNSTKSNLSEFEKESRLQVLSGSVNDPIVLSKVWEGHGPFDVVYHLAASIRVQDSIDDPRTTYNNDVSGTFEVLECCRRQYFEANGLKIGAPFHITSVDQQLQIRLPRFVFMSTCMVYDRATDPSGIDESHPTRPISPYGASKIAAENLVLSYYFSYKLPTKVIRPFNTYGPFQKSNMEGGVVPIFIARDLNRQPLQIKGDGKQTRDLLYVEDCARFVVEAGLTDKADGEIMNAGLGSDISIVQLASLIADPKSGGNGVPINHVTHDHPQAEIPKLLCNNSKAKRLLNWTPGISLVEGIQRTREWIRKNGRI